MGGRIALNTHALVEDVDVVVEELVHMPNHLCEVEIAKIACRN